LKDRNDFTTTIYCTESQAMVWPEGKDKNTDTSSSFYSTDWKDKKTGVVGSIWETSPQPVTLPRKTLCDSGNVMAYTMSGYVEEELGMDYSDQSHVVLCPIALDVTTSSWDRRYAGEIKSAGMRPDYYAIDHVKPLSRTLVHEFGHVRAVGGGMYAPFLFYLLASSPFRSRYVVVLQIINTDLHF
jgi:hypothetical protein